ncbi:TonB-dependent hemoglobin/transferrin/lactoferrin family receptor [Iodobacter sp. HSC-16F04]|uniref:TonB-dependent hemoglobin/transferrin/lactoferrin family receptor n=1 Tax=Iodobacter violaceini TaxID=3044271 RepID=A0ABX0KQT7_9NEIS|nr:TonB-dependent hemoglobin/transferrin/lactoferrin family receptor [Iodobacter violacea]NHQ84787.1 TonB-dependent hemoglobin/transferrin/lactoferrin family receptor [Iodobacter violacea]
MQRRTHAIALTLLAATLQSAFAASNASAPAAQLEPVVVTATRTDKKLDELPPSVSSTDRSELDRSFIKNYRDLASEEPGINISRNGRYGLSSVNVRGLEGNRVLMLVDGIRLPDAFSFGAYLNSGRDQVDFSQLSAIEVARGPSSTLYGSDALGGVVGLRTTSPSDMLRGRGNFAGQVKSDYDSSDQGLSVQAAVAGAFNQDTFWLLQAAQRKGHEFETQGTVDSKDYRRTTANPQNTNKRSVLAKAEHYFENGHKLAMAAENYRSEVDTTVYTDIGAPMTPSITGSQANDIQTRSRVSLDYNYTAPAQGLIDAAQAKLYYQTQNNEQTSTQQRRNVASWQRVSIYDQDMVGISGLIEKRIAGPISQHWTLGGEWLQNDLAALRTGTIKPVRDVPKTETTQWGIYAQNEMGWDEGRFTLTPALRYDAFKLRPELDAEFISQGGKAVALNDAKVSPKLTASWKIAEQITLFGQYSEGFRAPSAMELNSSYVSPMGYAAIANPDLKPETSRGAELGARLGNSTVGGSFTAFDNRYKDFIEQVSISCPGNPLCVPGTNVTYQSQNQSRVRIYGAESRAHWQISKDWRTWGNMAWTVGRNEDTDESLDSVAPLKAVLGLEYSKEQWGGNALLTATSAKTRVSQESYFKTPGYGTVDLALWWSPVRDLKLSGGVFNIADQKYWIDSDVRFLAANSSTLDRYSQPGRNIRVSADWRF